MGLGGRFKGGHVERWGTAKGQNGATGQRLNLDEKGAEKSAGGEGGIWLLLPFE